MIILLIIVIMSIFVTAYYIVYNVQWLVLNTAPEKYINSILNVSTHNSKIFVNGAPIFYIPYKNLLFFPWMLWIGWCILIGYCIAVIMFPLSMGITAYTLLKWVFLSYFCHQPMNTLMMIILMMIILRINSVILLQCL
ncbi:hypothetical protein [Yellowstone lake mimivirus]|uniref:hypothetical protein n=1 Tax=Yellowstone lake mimivirus TaxID=1586712 RepID=UPI0006EB5A6B|nr:hypothetical protein AR680_gp083 [Yellowstone lake mimivirus]BAT22007.1 hypothetical protein [Yellowstone lake mimivirus]